MVTSKRKKVLLVFRGNSKAKVKFCETGRRQSGSLSNKIVEINTTMCMKVYGVCCATFPGGWPRLPRLSSPFNDGSCFACALYDT